MKTKKVAEVILQQAGEFLCAKFKSDEVRTKARPLILFQYVGEAFEMMCEKRIAARFKGEVPKESIPTLKTELRAWGQSLTHAVGISFIKDALFDNVVEGVVQKHNKRAEMTRFAARLSVKPTTGKKYEEKFPIDAFAVEYMRPKALTLGDVLGAN
jgi:hypothetical protein